MDTASYSGTEKSNLASAGDKSGVDENERTKQRGRDVFIGRPRGKSLEHKMEECTF